PTSPLSCPTRRASDLDEEDQPLDGDVLESFQVPASEVLGEFRAKIQEIVRPEDVQTHYDLGIAYKEMGLLEEAIAEFDVALRHGGGTRAADCLTMLGVCESERGNSEAAVRHFQQGLDLLDLTSVARHALQFELGAVTGRSASPDEFSRLLRAGPGALLERAGLALLLQLAPALAGAGPADAPLLADEGARHPGGRHRRGKDDARAPAARFASGERIRRGAAGHHPQRRHRPMVAQ